MIQHSPNQKEVTRGAKKTPRERMTPVPTGRICLQPRDLEIMVFLDRFNYALRGQIEEAFFDSVACCNARMRSLFDWGYCAKAFVPLPYEMGAVYGCQTVYTCGIASFPLLAEHWGCDVKDVRARRRHSTPNFLLHTLEEVNFYLQVRRALREWPTAQLERYLGEWEAHHEYEFRPLPPSREEWQHEYYKPDSVMILSGLGGRAGYSIEIDRGHSSANAILQKVRLHERYRRLGLFLKRYGVEQDKTLLVTTSPKRRDHLRELFREEGSDLFWATTFEELKAQGVFGSIWQPAHGKGARRLSVLGKE